MFSCRGILIAVEWFRKRGHNVTVFVPNWRKEASKPDTPIIDQDILNQLEQDGVLSFTPSRRIQGKLVQCYDDRFIVKLAMEVDGVIVSNDHFRDLQEEAPEWQGFIERRLLMYTFANGDIFMPPDDPLGRHGPSLEEFLKITNEHKLRQCPYGRKCTFGHKCKFYHPERASKSMVFRPRSDPPIQQNPQSGSAEGGRRPISLPNLEQLFISHPPPKNLPYGAVQQGQSQGGRPVSGPPFPEGQFIQAEFGQTQRVRSASDMMQSTGTARKISGEFTHFIASQGGQFVHPVMQRQLSTSGCEYGRPLSSDFGSRPSSGDYSYSSGSRPPSGEFSASRPSSGDYGTLPWPVSGSPYQTMQRQVSFPSSVRGSQMAYVDTRNFYPVKRLFNTRGPPMPETKEEIRTPSGPIVKMDLVNELRNLFPDQFDKIVNTLRNHPDITSVEEATYYLMNE